MNAAKLRTSDDLDSFVTAELTWRRRELRATRSLLSLRPIPEPGQNVLLRCNITLLYAHWEGLVKGCATAYVCYVSMCRLSYQKLAPHFLALALRSAIKGVAATNDASRHIDFSQFLVSGLDGRSKIDWKNAVDTESNLSSTVFRNIVTQLGFDYLSKYETKQRLLDSLLKKRNEAAHGEHLLTLTRADFEEPYIALVGGEHEEGLMESFVDQIRTAAKLRAFART